MPDYAKKLADVTTRLAKMSSAALLTTAGEKVKLAKERGPLTKFQEYEIWQEVLDKYEADHPPAKSPIINLDMSSTTVSFTAMPTIREYIVTEDMLAKPKEE